MTYQRISKIAGIFAIGAFLFSSPALADDTSSPPGAKQGRTILVNLNGLKIHRNGVRAADGNVALPAATFVTIPELAANINCKSGVAKCAIQLDIQVDVAGGATGRLAICPQINGANAGPCNYTSVLGGTFLEHRSTIIVERPVGSVNAVTVRLFADSASSLNDGVIRLTSMYK
jgi:hypothetical protein